MTIRPKTCTEDPHESVVDQTLPGLCDHDGSDHDWGRIRRDRVCHAVIRTSLILLLVAGSVLMGYALSRACDQWPKIPPVGRIILERSLSNGLLLRQFTTNGDRYSNYASYTRVTPQGEEAYPLMFAADFPHGHPLDDGEGTNGLNGLADATFINTGSTETPPPCSEIRLYHGGKPQQKDTEMHVMNFHHSS